MYPIVLKTTLRNRPLCPECLSALQPTDLMFACGVAFCRSCGTDYVNPKNRLSVRLAYRMARRDLWESVSGLGFFVPPTPTHRTASTTRRWLKKDAGYDAGNCDGCDTHRCEDCVQELHGRAREIADPAYDETDERDQT